MILVAAAGGLVEQYVARLDVAVHEPARVRGVQRRRHLGRDVGHARRGQRAHRVEQPADVSAVDEAHGNEQHAFGLARLENGDDIGMINGRGGPRLADEPPAERVVLGQAWSQDLERDAAV